MVHPRGMADPLILTLDLGAHQARLDALRERHFPPRPYRLPAHLTLFHQLPGEEEPAVAAHLREVAAVTPVPAYRLAGPMSLGRGVAVRVESPGAEAIRASIAARWRDRLAAQDRGFRPHVTIQNKVSPEEARATLEGLAAGFEPEDGVFPALLLWRYRGGPWEEAGRFEFTGAESSR